MKKNSKLIVAIIFVCILLTGCGSNSGGILNSKKTMTCTKEEVDGEGYKTTENMEITYNTSKVLKVKATNVSETDPSYIEMQLSFGNVFAEKLNEIDGLNINYSKKDNNKIEITMEIDYEKIKPEQIKNILGDLYSEEDSMYDKNNYTIDEFKQKNLDGYTCK